MFKSAGAIYIRIEASRKTRMVRGVLVGEDDIIEVGLDDVKDWDYVIENNSTYEDLKKKVYDLVKVLNS